MSNTWSKYLYSRGMRLSTCTFSSTLLIFAFTLNLIIQDAMIGEWELDTKDYHITIIDLSREVQKLDEIYSCFTSTHIYIFPKCPPFIFRFSSNTLWPLWDVLTYYYAYLWSIVLLLLCYTLWIIIEHPCIEYLISLHKLSCILLLLLRMNHFTLCSNSNHLWYPLIVLKLQSPC
jgi:hypothetical protein